MEFSKKHSHVVQLRKGRGSWAEVGYAAAMLLLPSLASQSFAGSMPMALLDHERIASSHTRIRESKQTTRLCT